MEGGLMQDWVLLADLPPGHFARRLPLAKLEAEARNFQQTGWRKVAGWAIGKVRYDDLGDAWTTTIEFRFPLN